MVDLSTIQAYTMKMFAEGTSIMVDIDLTEDAKITKSSKYIL